MQPRRLVLISSYLLSLLAVGLAVVVRLPSASSITTYSLFPLLGLIAFGLMWAHYVSDALRRWYRVPKDALQSYFQLTSAIVLVCILLHPGLLQLQLYIDGLGPPPFSFFTIYPSLLERVAIIAGVIALICFLAFEFRRLYIDRPWWRFVQWANIGAMLLILWHGFILGGELSSDWFRIVWIGYAITFVLSAVYSHYDKQRSQHEPTK